MTQLPQELREAVEKRLGTKLQRALPLGGGDINAAYRVHMTDGREVFLKTHPQLPAAAFEAEAAGLRWLTESGLSCPQVLGFSRYGATLGYLLLDYIQPGPTRSQSAESLGVALARLHSLTDESWGWKRHNWIGALYQDNHSCSTWSEFYWRRRLEPQIRLAVQACLLSENTLAQFHTLEAKLENRVEPESQPARLHGDLWSGNCLWDRNGGPVFIDPACYCGSREIDLAMMRLFGGFAEATFAAYQEASPLADGHAERVGLYQLYPLLVHVNLFGGAYVRQLAAVLRSVV